MKKAQKTKTNEEKNSISGHEETQNYFKYFEYLNDDIFMILTTIEPAYRHSMSKGSYK